jgi:A/G-specific adenine glycosylase
VQNEEFKELIWQKGKELYRDMPWRRDTRPYYVLVSELMLQQTQVARVIPKFESFITAFPNEHALATASLADVLIAWQGLGYNRRAKFLHEAAKRIVNDFANHFPDAEADILSLPGVGKNTAGAIGAYAFNRPTLFIETNVRTVYIHHFFNDAEDVDDKHILEKLRRTIDHEHPREFYWALMDYGSSLKTSGIKNISQSKHYKKQSPLEGSVRQVRGQIIRQLHHGATNEPALRLLLNADKRFELALSGLQKDGLITVHDGQIHLTK